MFLCEGASHQFGRQFLANRKLPRLWTSLWNWKMDQRWTVLQMVFLFHWNMPSFFLGGGGDVCAFWDTADISSGPSDYCLTDWINITSLTRMFTVRHPLLNLLLIGSMYDIYSYINHTNQPNGRWIYQSHGSYGVMNIASICDCFGKRGHTSNYPYQNWRSTQ